MQSHNKEHEQGRVSSLSCPVLPEEEEVEAFVAIEAVKEIQQANRVEYLE